MKCKCRIEFYDGRIILSKENFSREFSVDIEAYNSSLVKNKLKEVLLSLDVRNLDDSIESLWYNLPGFIRRSMTYSGDIPFQFAGKEFYFQLSQIDA